VTEIDALFARVRSGDAMAFAEWMGRVERPIRASLHRFSRAVDLEVVMQETFLRMWLMATRSDRLLQGEKASLRMALAVARNVAREEVRRAKLGSLVPLEDLENAPELIAEPEPLPDPGLARAIRDCIERIPGRPRAALELRIAGGHARPDRDLAEELGLKLNTFLQHIVRARRSLAECLMRKGVELAGVWS
jgi:RNA polymerase sigma-70 factor (ECF subfamily)